MGTIDFGLANNVDPIKQQQQAFSYADMIRQKAASLQSGQQFAQGDYQGASKTQAQAGNIPEAQQTQQFGQDTAAKGQAYIASALPVFQAIQQAHANDPDQGAAAIGAAFDHIAPEVQAVTGANPQALQQFRQQLVSDPKGTIARLQAQIPITDKVVGDSLMQFQGPKLLNTYTGAKTITAPPGSNVLQIGGGVTPAAAPADPNASSVQPAPASPGGSSQASQTSPTESDVQGFITKNIPGAIITSGQRSPDHNAAVGGVPDSLHIPGQAVDFVMPKGMDFSQVQQIVAQSGLQPTELLNEGSHVHLAWGPKGGVQVGSNSATLPQGAAPPANGVTVLQRGGPVWRAPTPDELKQYPGATQINTATGEAKYPPLSAIGAAMTPDQLQPLVDIVKAGGTLPARAMSNPTVYSNILKLAQEQGVPVNDFLANQGNRKATQAAFQQINTRYQMVQTQESAFQNSLNLAYSLAQKAGPQGGGTLLNGWRNYLKTGVVGDPSTGAFINAVKTAMNEYGKIIEGSTGNAGSSISARDDANQMLSGADNLPAFVAKMQVLQQDAGYKIGSLKDQHDTLLQTLGSIGQGQQDAPPAGQGGGTLTPGTTKDGIPVLAPASVLKLKTGDKFYGTDGVLRQKK